MKKWSYEIKLPNNSIMTSIEFDSIEKAIHEAITVILFDNILKENFRFTISFYDYPHPHNQAIHIFEFNIMK